jgi:phosphohistidine phosphatase
MRVLIIRHGEAVPSEEAFDEATRWLTPQGRRIARSVGTAVTALGVRPTQMFTSPLTRAVQTAEIFAGAFEIDGPLRILPGLAFGATADALTPLDEAAAGDTIALVGHMPLVATMASHLIGKQVPSFKPAMVCSIARDEHGTRFEWLLDPDTLRRITAVELRLA